MPCNSWEGCTSSSSSSSPEAVWQLGGNWRAEPGLSVEAALQVDEFYNNLLDGKSGISLITVRLFAPSISWCYHPAPAPVAHASALPPQTHHTLGRRPSVSGRCLGNRRPLPPVLTRIPVALVPHIPAVHAPVSPPAVDVQFVCRWPGVLSGVPIRPSEAAAAHAASSGQAGAYTTTASLYRQPPPAWFTYHNCRTTQQPPHHLSSRRAVPACFYTHTSATLIVPPKSSPHPSALRSPNACTRWILQIYATIQQCQL